jgi:hypothetical protein
MAQLSAQRNDAFGGAMNSAIMQGTQAGESMFRQGMQGRQQSISEALRQRSMPMSDLQDLMGFTQQQPEFAKAGQTQAPDLLGAGLGSIGLSQENAKWKSQEETDRTKAAFDLISGFINMIPRGGK